MYAQTCQGRAVRGQAEQHLGLDTLTCQGRAVRGQAAVGFLTTSGKQRKVSLRQAVRKDLKRQPKLISILFAWMLTANAPNYP